ncbi:MAG: hypothetical protein RR348_02475 [Clostridia bacterium]
MEYNFFTWWMSTKVKPLAFKIWRYVITPINFLALTLFVSVFQEYLWQYFVMMFIPIFCSDIIWDGFNFYSYRKDREAELQTLENGENLVEKSIFEDEYNEDKIAEKGEVGAAVNHRSQESEIVFEDEKKNDAKRGVLTKIKSFLTFSRDRTDIAPTVSKERKREIKLQRKYDISILKSKTQQNAKVLVAKNKEKENIENNKEY